MIVCLRTDRPLAELYLYQDSQQLASDRWSAHRQLSASLLTHLEALLASRSATLNDLTGLVVFTGPGSFTGLRIGLTVANTLAYSLQLPIVGSRGPQWRRRGVARLAQVSSPQIIQPFYGREPHLTQPKK